MSTRMNVTIKNTDTGENLHFYRHHDGYPLHGVGFLATAFEFFTTPETEHRIIESDDGTRKSVREETGNRVLKRLGSSAGAMNHILTNGLRRNRDNPDGAYGLGLEFDAASVGDEIRWKRLHGDIEYAYIIYLENGEVSWVEAYQRTDWDADRIDDSLERIWQGRLMSLADHVDGDSLAAVESDTPPTYGRARVFVDKSDDGTYRVMDSGQPLTDYTGAPVTFDDFDSARAVASHLQDSYDTANVVVQRNSDGSQKKVTTRN